MKTTYFLGLGMLSLSLCLNSCDNGTSKDTKDTTKTGDTAQAKAPETPEVPKISSPLVNTWSSTQFVSDGNDLSSVLTVEYQFKDDGTYYYLEGDTTKGNWTLDESGSKLTLVSYNGKSKGEFNVTVKDNALTMEGKEHGIKRKIGLVPKK